MSNIKFLPWRFPLTICCKAGENYIDNLVGIARDVESQMKEKYESVRVNYLWCPEEFGYGSRELSGIEVLGSNSYFGIPGIVDWTEYFPLLELGNKECGQPIKSKDDLTYKIHGVTNQEAIEKILSSYNLN